MKLRFLLVLLLIPPTGEASNEGAACFTIKDFIDRISNLPSMPNKALANIAKSSTCLVLEMKSENRDEPKSWRTGILISDDLVITCRHQSKPNQDISTDPNDWFVRFDYLEEIRYVDLKKLKDPAWVKIQKVEIAPDFAWHVKSEQDYKIHPFADWVVLKLETRQSRSVFPIQSMPYQNITTPFIPNHSAIKPAFYWKAGQYDNWQILTVKEAEEKVRLRQDFFLHPFYYPSEMLITFPSLSSPIINIANPSPYVLIEGKFVTHAGASGSPVINDQGRANSIHLVGQDNNQGKPDFSIGIVNTKGEVSKSIRYELLFDADIGSNLVKRNFENISVNTLWRTYKDQIDVGTLTNPKFYSWSEFVIPPIPFDRPYNPDRDRRYENVNGVPIRNDYWVNWHPEAKIGIAGGDQIYIVKSGVNYGFNMLGQTIYGLTASVNPPAEKASQVWVAATFASAAHNTVSENFIIEWDNGKSEKVPASEYNRAILGIPKILSHVYRKPKSYNIKVSWKTTSIPLCYWEWCATNTETKLIPVTIPQMTPPDYGVREEYIPYFIEMGSGIEHYPFFMSQTEVTQREYGYILEAWPFATFNPGSAEKPAENISWYDAILYCNALSIKQGLEPVYSFSGPPVYETSEQLNCIALDGLNCDWSKNGYRLPTAKEWQFAYLAGQKPDLNNGYFFTEGELSDYAWTNVSELHSVARKRPNRWGLFDMAGNVREWVWDDRTHIACGLGGNYQGDHVDVYASACANKKGYWPFVGFRVVRNAPLPPDFTVFANKTEISAGESIEFSAMQTVNSGPVISYYWLFGDGYAGAGRTTKYKFQTSGEYTVKCIAKGEYPRATTTVAVNTKIKVGNTIKLINRDWLSINKFEYFDGITWNTVGANDSRIKYVGAYWGSGECSNSRTGWEDEVETGPSTVEFSFFGSGIRIYTGSQQYQKADVFINGAFISTIVPSEDDCNNLSFEKTGL